jgi:hypothetical protein
MEWNTLRSHVARFVHLAQSRHNRLLGKSCVDFLRTYGHIADLCSKHGVEHTQKLRSAFSSPGAIASQSIAREKLRGLLEDLQAYCFVPSLRSHGLARRLRTAIRQPCMSRASDVSAPPPDGAFRSLPGSWPQFRRPRIVRLHQTGAHLPWTPGTLPRPE